MPRHVCYFHCAWVCIYKHQLQMCHQSLIPPRTNSRLGLGQTDVANIQYISINLLNCFLYDMAVWNILTSRGIQITDLSVVWIWTIFESLMPVLNSLNITKRGSWNSHPFACGSINLKDLVCFLYSVMWLILCVVSTSLNTRQYPDMIDEPSDSLIKQWIPLIFIPRRCY